MGSYEASTTHYSAKTNTQRTFQGTSFVQPHQCCLKSIFNSILNQMVFKDFLKIITDGPP